MDMYFGLNMKGSRDGILADYKALLTDPYFSSLHFFDASGKLYRITRGNTPGKDFVYTTTAFDATQESEVARLVYYSVSDMGSGIEGKDIFEVLPISTNRVVYSNKLYYNTEALQGYIDGYDLEQLYYHMGMWDRLNNNPMDFLGNNLIQQANRRYSIGNHQFISFEWQNSLLHTYMEGYSEIDIYHHSDIKYAVLQPPYSEDGLTMRSADVELLQKDNPDFLEMYEIVKQGTIEGDPTTEIFDSNDFIHGTGDIVVIEWPTETKVYVFQGGNDLAEVNLNVGNKFLLRMHNQLDIFKEADLLRYIQTAGFVDGDIEARSKDIAEMADTISFIREARAQEELDVEYSAAKAIMSEATRADGWLIDEDAQYYSEKNYPWLVATRKHTSYKVAANMLVHTILINSTDPDTFVTLKSGAQLSSVYLNGSLLGHDEQHTAQPFIMADIDSITVQGRKVWEENERVKLWSEVEALESKLSESPNIMPVVDDPELAEPINLQPGAVYRDKNEQEFMIVATTDTEIYYLGLSGTPHGVMEKQELIEALQEHQYSYIGENHSDPSDSIITASTASLHIGEWYINPIKAEQYSVTHYNNSHVWLYNPQGSTVMPLEDFNEDFVHEPSYRETLSAKESTMQLLKNGVLNAQDSKGFKSWCDSLSNMFLNRYSMRNSFLITLQNPDASYVMGFEQWKQYGRQVKAGSKGLRILAPEFLRERGAPGALYGHITQELERRLADNKAAPSVTYPLTSSIAIEGYPDGSIRPVINGTPLAVMNKQEFRKFLYDTLTEKQVVGFRAITVFDVADTYEPEYLWLKDGFLKSEMVKDARDQPIINSKGEYKIRNTQQRINKLSMNLDLSVPARDPERMKVLLSVLEEISKENGVPIRKEPIPGACMGYYSRATNPEIGAVNGYIALDENLPVAEMAATALHEVSHSRMHKDLDKLQEQMGDTPVDRHIKEVQAEATAYIVARGFGLDTDTRSFNYLATWAKDKSFSELEQSMEIIWKNAQQLMKDIEQKLDERGLTQDLTEKREPPLVDVEACLCVLQEYVVTGLDDIDEVREQMEDVKARLRGMDDPIISDMLKEQALVLRNIELKAGNMLDASEAAREAIESGQLDEAKRKEQQATTLAASLSRLEDRFKQKKEEVYTYCCKQFAKMDVSFPLKYSFAPLEALKDIQENYSELQKLNDGRLDLIAKSAYVRSQLATYSQDTDGFVEMALEHLKRIEMVASREKTGSMAIEIVSASYGGQPFFEPGMIMHPAAYQAEIEGVTEELRQKEHGRRNITVKLNIIMYSCDKAGATHALEIAHPLSAKVEADLVKDLIEYSKTSKDDVSAFAANLAKAMREKGGTVAVPEQRQLRQQDTGSTVNIPMEKWQASVNRVKEDQGLYVGENGETRGHYEKTKNQQKG